MNWCSDKSTAAQLGAWIEKVRDPGVLHVRFAGNGCGQNAGWDQLSVWTRSRAVTVAEVMSSLSCPALELALCCDFVYLHEETELILHGDEPSAGLLWALGRAGRRALARGLLDPSPIPDREAVRLGLAQGAIGPDEALVVGHGGSLTALTTARDLMRCTPQARPAIELAAFRLLFASGDPGEGARAFFGHRTPRFPD